MSLSDDTSSRLPSSQVFADPTGTTDALGGSERCIVCNGPYSSPGWVHCCICKEVLHTSCIVKQHKGTGAEGPKNGITWLHGLLNSMYFRLICPSCDTALSHKVQSNADSHVDALRGQMSSMATRVDEVHAELLQKIMLVHEAFAKPATTAN
jgi:hypothetical protein